MCCNRKNYKGFGLIILFILMIIIASISILTHTTIGYVIGILLLVIAFALFIKIVIINQNYINNDMNDIKYTIEPYKIKDLNIYHDNEKLNVEIIN